MGRFGFSIAPVSPSTGEPSSRWPMPWKGVGIVCLVFSTWCSDLRMRSGRVAGGSLASIGWLRMPVRRTLGGASGRKPVGLRPAGGPFGAAVLTGVARVVLVGIGGGGGLCG